MEYKDTIAREDEVLERAMELFKKASGKEVTREQFEELYDIQARYIRENVTNGKWGAIFLSCLGTAYFPKTNVTKKKNKYKGLLKLDDSDSVKEGYQRWLKMESIIEDTYQKNQPGRNVGKHHKWFHMIMPWRIIQNRFGYPLERIEEIQNEIE